MDCHEVKELLSAYADGVLTEAETSLVKEHLDLCPDCMDTYEAMSRIIEHMHHMETVVEPDGFLDRVNARLEKPSFLAGVFRRLFVPPGVKLPLELAAVAVALVLIFYLAGFWADGDLYEITISLKDRIDSKAVETMTHERGGATKKAEKRGAVGAPSIQSIISSIDGKVIESEYREHADTLSSLIAEIRADKYQLLLKELSRLGVIQKYPPEEPEKSEELIRVRITLQ